MKADVQGFPKMWYFSKFGDFKPELLQLKVGSNLKSQVVLVFGIVLSMVVRDRQISGIVIHIWYLVLWCILYLVFQCIWYKVVSDIWYCNACCIVFDLISGIVLCLIVRGKKADRVESIYSKGCNMTQG